MKAVAPAASWVRASSGTGKSGGPRGSSCGADDVWAASGSVSLACCLLEQPLTSAAVTTRPVTNRRLHRRRTVVLPADDHRSRDITQITNLAALRLWIQPADHAKE